MSIFFWYRKANLCGHTGVRISENGYGYRLLAPLSNSLPWVLTEGIPPIDVVRDDPQLEIAVLIGAHRSGSRRIAGCLEVRLARPFLPRRLCAREAAILQPAAPLLGCSWGPFEKILPFHKNIH